MLLRVFGLPFCSSSVESVSGSVAKSLWVAFLQFLCGICLRECCQESLGCLFAVPLWNLSQRVLPRVSGLPFCSSPVESVSVSLESVAKSLWVSFFAVPLWNLSLSVSLDPVEVLAKSLGWRFLQYPCGIYFSVPSVRSLWVDLFCSSPVKSVWVFLEIIEKSLWVGCFCSSPVKSVLMFLEIIAMSLWVGLF